MSKKMPKIWEAPAHTLAKIEILRSYLHAWFSILGSTFTGRDLWYIDGFAGPGEYTNTPEGSPIAALNAADAVLKGGSRWVAGRIRCVFIEEDPERCAHLLARLEQTPVDPRITVDTLLGTFAAGLKSLKKRADNPFTRTDPLFAFIDPFGARGFSFPIVAELLSRPSSEVLINLDSDGIRRIFRAQEAANHREVLNEVFGDPDWEAEFSTVKGDDPRAIMAAYRRRLRALPGVGYAFAFEMCSGKAAINYHLIFASQHPLGLEKMKGAMRKMDQDGTYRFSSVNVGQGQLFEFQDASTAADQMMRRFAGQTVPYVDLEAYALNESPFINPKSMLKLLETRDRITVLIQGEARRKGTFPDSLRNKISVRFNRDDEHG